MDGGRGKGKERREEGEGVGVGMRRMGRIGCRERMGFCERESEKWTKFVDRKFGLGGG